MASTATYSAPAEEVKHHIKLKALGPPSSHMALDPTLFYRSGLCGLPALGHTLHLIFCQQGWLTSAPANSGKYHKEPNKRPPHPSPLPSFLHRKLLRSLLSSAWHSSWLPLSGEPLPPLATSPNAWPLGGCLTSTAK